MIAYVLLGCFLLIVFVTDMTKSIIPNRYTISFTVIGLFYHTILGGLSGLFSSFIGCILGFTILALLYLFRAVGAGDVKLFAAIGALAGTSFMLMTLMYAVLYSGLIGVVVMLTRLSSVQKLKKKIYISLYSVLSKEKRLFQYRTKNVTQFPFMLAVLPGAVTAFGMLM